ncbi:single-stranded-DNA-specific exonuclease RecJ [Chrysiogenes arsenatis]|uniref:single-stranded-DNA-specific exonuclease RecJ n=1 Tax=Chrysiogenes arsenatis TaxID=309797 RepID=UPI000403D469|nr:single-stranded-DNA-specific exonuclease RecJ [Chrysiogenes arsenatis]
MLKTIQGNAFVWKYQQPAMIENFDNLLKFILEKRQEEGEFLLNPTLADLSDPMEMLGMAEAVACTAEILQQKGNIVIYGDYDVDGTVATAVLVRFLRQCGAQVTWHIPDRFSEGYGLHRDSMLHLAQSAALIITVDCGISGVAEAEILRQHQIPLIITDHHQVPAELPHAHAIVNPHQPGCRSRFKELSGTAVALKFAIALRKHLGRKDISLAPLLPLVALATVADVMPLIGENRTIVQHGLRLFRETPFAGLRALCHVANVDLATIRSGDLGFALAPRLNAAGRLEHASQALELLLCDNDEDAAVLATQLNALNLARREIEQQTVQEAYVLIEERQLERFLPLVVARTDWNEGVIGIVASRLKSHFYKPALVCAIGEDGIAKGSCRSVDGIDIRQHLEVCADILEGFGGHPMAAGFRIAVENIDTLRQRLHRQMEKIAPEVFQPKLDVAGTVAPPLLTLQSREQLRVLEPFGRGNEEPVLVANFRLIDVQRLGHDGKHSRLTLVDPSGGRHQGIAFSQNLQPMVNKNVLLAFRLDINTWNGRSWPQLVVVDYAAG